MLTFLRQLVHFALCINLSDVSLFLGSLFFCFCFDFSNPSMSHRCDKWHLLLFSIYHIYLFFLYNEEQNLFRIVLGIILFQMKWVHWLGSWKNRKIQNCGKFIEKCKNKNYKKRTIWRDLKCSTWYEFIVGLHVDENLAAEQIVNTKLSDR